MKRPIPYLVLTVCVFHVLAAIGCAGSDKPKRRAVQPTDFSSPTAQAARKGVPKSELRPSDVVVSGSNNDTDSATDAASQANNTTGSDTAVTPSVRTTDKPPVPNDTRLTVDAMIGQVNGRALYANKVLEPLEPALSELGKTVPRVEFERQAGRLIHGRLQELVHQESLLGEAERDLVPQEQLGLKLLLQKKREELINEYGLGSPERAKVNIERKTGRTLEQTLEFERQKLVVQKFLRKKFFPKINVTRKDIKRYYKEHFDEFNPPPTRTLRVVRVVSDNGVASVEKALADGTPFAEVAKLPANLYRRATGGLMADVEGNTVFGGALDEAMLKLEQGRHTGKLVVNDATWWVFVEKLERGEGKPLIEVQTEIENKLRTQRFSTLTRRFREDLLAEHDHPIDKMRDSLLAVAMTRWAAQR